MSTTPKIADLNLVRPIYSLSSQQCMSRIGRLSFIQQAVFCNNEASISLSNVNRGTENGETKTHAPLNLAKHFTW